MAFVAPTDMNFSMKNIIMILSGLPSTWKTSLAFSAPDCVLFDLDEGLARVDPHFRKDASICKNYEEFLSDVETIKKNHKYKTVIIDTCGALIELMKDWAMRTDPKASKKDGGFSLQGYGIIKSEFLRLSSDLRRNFNVIFVFHESMEKNEDGSIYYNIVVEGSARTLVYQPADLAGHLFIQGGRHFIGFTPTEQYMAKSSYGIKGIMELPEVGEGEENVFLTKLFAKVRKNLDAQAQILAPQKSNYDEVMVSVREFVANIEKPEDVIPALQAIKGLPHALTSKEEAQAAVKARVAELGIVYDKATKSYKYAEAE